MKEASRTPPLHSSAEKGRGTQIVSGKGKSDRHIKHAMLSDIPERKRPRSSTVGGMEGRAPEADGTSGRGRSGSRGAPGTSKTG